MKLNYKRTILVGFAFLAISGFWQMYDQVIPKILSDTFHLPDFLTGIIMAIDNVLALFLLPIFGTLSDRTHTKFGRRRPFVLIGSVGAAACMLMMPFADKLGSLPFFMVGLGLTLIFMSSYRSPAVALMPDVTLKPLRSKGNAIINLMGTVGGLISLVLIKLLVPAAPDGVTDFRPNYVPLFIAVAGVILVAALVLLLFVNENALVEQMHTDAITHGIAEESKEEKASREARTSVPLGKAKTRSMIFLLLSVFFWFMGYNGITTSYSRYFGSQFGIGVGDSSLILTVALAAAAIAFIPIGFLATRIGRKKTILLGISLLFVAFASGSFFLSYSNLMYLLFACAGIAWAAINVNSYPMVVEMAADGDVGRFTGYYYTASMLAQTITAPLSGLILDLMKLLHIPLLFPYGAIFVALSFVTMLFVKHGDAKPTVAADKLEQFADMD